MEQEVMSLSLLDLAVKGGWIMIVLLLLSVLAIYIFGKKIWLNGTLEFTYLEHLHIYTKFVKSIFEERNSGR